MLFQTWTFFFFILIVIAFIATVKVSRYQHVGLLFASYVFYGWWDVRFLVLLALTSVVDYLAALGIGGHELPLKKRIAISAAFLVFSFACLGINWFEFSGAEKDVALGFTSDFASQYALMLCCVIALLLPVYLEVIYKAASRRSLLLVTSLVVNLGILAFFKYFNFFVENLKGLSTFLGATWEAPMLYVVLPVGISFYTFQTLSYTIDVYRKVISPERSFVRLALYVSYFPQLVAGPILRPSQFLPTLNKSWRFESKNVISGCNLFLVGLCKKVLIADQVAPLVDHMLSDASSLSSILLLLAAALFAVQIYCDFSGYTDMARGISRIFGVEIPINFNLPYFSCSITEFWRRWHISLSSWLRDYLYVPLGGNRIGAVRTYANLLITMVLGGLWHGASWNFIIWGAYQGVLLCLHRVLVNRLIGKDVSDRLGASLIWRVVTWAFTLYLTLVGWLIFRVTDIDELLSALPKLILFDGDFSVSALGLGQASPFTAMLAFFAFVVFHTWGAFKTRWPDYLDSLTTTQRSVAYVILGAVLFFGWPTTEQAFIYFQF